jgi:hypothetical protein
MVKMFGEEIELPLADNTAEALQIYRAVNKRLRQTPWPLHSIPPRTRYLWATRAIFRRSPTARYTWS